MSTIEQAIKAAQAKLANPPVTRQMVGDDEVSRWIAQLAERGYIPSPQIVEPVRAYASGYGILLAGNAGIGKTFLMQCLRARLYTATSIAEYGLAAIAKWFSWTDGHDVCIDDIGTESIVSEYGAKDDVLKRVIAHRAEQQRGRTSITTNLDAAAIKERYGDRTLSRILGMCKAFRMDGANRRGV